MNTIDQVHPGDVLMDPHNKTTMWRLLEIDKGSNRVRLVRSNKAGAIHGLVKDPSGHWEQASSIQKFVVIANFQGKDAPRPPTARAIRNGAQAASAAPAPKTPRKRVDAAAELPDESFAGRIEGSTDLLKFMKTFHESMAKGLDEIIRSR